MAATNSGPCAKDVWKNAMKTKSSRRRRGRPTKFTPATVGKFCRAVADGLPYKSAAAAAGISHETVCQWQRQFPEFSDAVQLALAKAEVALVRLIRRAAAKGNWKASAWLLERRYPEHWGRRDRLHAQITEVAWPGATAIKADVKAKEPIDYGGLEKVARQLFGLPPRDGDEEPVHPTSPEAEAGVPSGDTGS
jgi:hypothetical protein